MLKRTRERERELDDHQAALLLEVEKKKINKMILDAIIQLHTLLTILAGLMPCQATLSNKNTAPGFLFKY